MPNSKHSKGHRNLNEDVHNNNVNGQAQGNHHVNRDRMERQNHQNGVHAGNRLQQCCVPEGCTDDPIDPLEPMDSVKVICNNESCTEGNWMHKECFIVWEQSVLSFLRSCGRARSWSEKQRLQNLWTKKGYDLAYKACDCKCGRGHLRKDLDHIPPVLTDASKKVRKNKKKNDKPMPVVSTNHKSGYNHNHQSVDAHHVNVENQQHHRHESSNKTVKKEGTTNSNTITNGNGRRRGSDNTNNNTPATNTSTTTSNTNITNSRSRNNSVNQNDTAPDSPLLDNCIHNPMAINYSSNPVNVPNGMHSALRLRTNSVSSTGSIGSQASSCGSIPGSVGSLSPLSTSPVTGNNLFFKPTKKAESPETAQSSLFRHRQDLSAFTSLPRYKQNPYNIHIEDVQEDDETRNFVLSNLTTKRMTALRCVLCKTSLPVFDRFPLVDGTLFLSPQAYDQFVVQVIWEGRIQFLNSVCIACLEGASGAKCSSCKKGWNGTSFVVGTMYTFDIFAALPCCQKRLTCKHCHRAVIDVSTGVSYFSQYSRMIICPYCKANDFHFIRPLPETFSVKEPICGSV